MTNAAKTLGLLYRKTMYPPDDEAKAKAEKILQARVWDDSLTYSPAPPAEKVGGKSSGPPPQDVEMTDASSEVTAPAQVVPPKSPWGEAPTRYDASSRAQEPPTDDEAASGTPCLTTEIFAR